VSDKLPRSIGRNVSEAGLDSERLLLGRGRIALMPREQTSWFEQIDRNNLDELVRVVEELRDDGGNDAVEKLIELLEHCLGDYNKRSLVSSLIEALGELKVKKAEGVLLRALKSHLYLIKGAAAEALGKVEPSEQAVDEIKHVIDDDAPKEIKKEAIRGLGKSKKPRAVEYLVDVVQSEPDKELKQEAVEAIGKTNDSRATHPLIEYYRREANDKLKTDIIRALSEIGTNGALTLLFDALKDENPEIRSCAALALGEIGSPEAVLSVKALLADPEEEVRKNVAKALGLFEFLPR
jgi:HEAT repeat protein